MTWSRGTLAAIVHRDTVDRCVRGPWFLLRRRSWLLPLGAVPITEANLSTRVAARSYPGQMGLVPRRPVASRRRELVRLVRPPRSAAWRRARKAALPPDTWMATQSSLPKVRPRMSRRPPPSSEREIPRAVLATRSSRRLLRQQQHDRIHHRHGLDHPKRPSRNLRDAQPSGVLRHRQGASADRGLTDLAV